MQLHRRLPSILNRRERCSIGLVMATLSAGSAQNADPHVAHAGTAEPGVPRYEVMWNCLGFITDQLPASGLPPKRIVRGSLRTASRSPRLSATEHGSLHGESLSLAQNHQHLVLHPPCRARGFGGSRQVQKVVSQRPQHLRSRQASTHCLIYRPRT